jgi:nitroreductase
MDIYEAVRERTSIRAYKPDPIEEDKLERILDAARLAPSGKNGQPWTFIVVKDEEIRRKLVPACKNQEFVGQAPVVVVACGNEERAYKKMGGYWNSMPLDIGIAIEHLMLAAVSEGLGTCWIGAFFEEQVREILGVPEGVKIVALTPIGYPAGEKTPRPRKSLDEIIMHDRWEE